MRVIILTSILSLILPLVAADKIVMVDRNYYSYGYEGNITEGAPNGFAFGMGGLEKTSFDSKEKILYGISEQGFITLIDYGNGPVDAPQLPIVITDNDTYTDIHVCSDQGILFASTKDDPNPGHVAIYKVATRSDDTVTEPELMHTIEVGYGPDMLAPNSDCSILAVANEGEGDYDDAVGLINPEGSVTLVKGPFDDATTQPTVSHVSFPWTDEELLAKGIHLPLSLNAMEYWDDHSSIADEIDFSSARENYTGASVLEPEWLVWSADEKYVLVNLQENSALVKVNVADEVAEDIYSYGLKSWETTPVDVVEDDGCSNMPTVEGLFSVRSPDAIAAININGETYIATANEGDDLSYGGFDEKLKSKDIFSGSSLGLVNSTADPLIFDPTDPMAGQSKYFNADCEDAADGPEWCSDSMRMSIGSEMIDYSDPTNIVVKSMIAIGGRGITIYKLNDDGLDLVWDSASEFEVEGCKAYPWAHNGIQDEEFANVNGTLYMADEGIRETLEEMNDPNIDGCEDGGDGQPGACALGDTVDERSAKDGYAAEAVRVGQACGKTYLVTVSEKNSVGFLYDLTDISSPKLTQVFHLSPESETKNPTVAYEDRTLGEIDSESILFLDETESPTGVPSIIFAGAWSSTTSYWEFECSDSVSVTDSTATNGDSTATETNGGSMVTETNGDSTSTEGQDSDSDSDADAGAESDGAGGEVPIAEEESASGASATARSLISATIVIVSAATFL